MEEEVQVSVPCITIVDFLCDVYTRHVSSVIHLNQLEWQFVTPSYRGSERERGTREPLQILPPCIRCEI